MLDFARCLPSLRAHIGADLAGDELSRTRVLACATRLLDIGFFRIGTEGYAEQNQSYGLATIQKRHVRLVGDEVRFDYIAKSGKRRLQPVVDPDGPGPGRAHTGKACSRRLSRYVGLPGGGTLASSPGSTGAKHRSPEIFPDVSRAGRWCRRRAGPRRRRPPR
ncbi:MAG: hypothetical protein ACR2MO_17490 [Acidimicrobiales bacterium]